MLGSSPSTTSFNGHIGRGGGAAGEVGGEGEGGARGKPHVVPVGGEEDEAAAVGHREIHDARRAVVEGGIQGAGDAEGPEAVAGGGIPLGGAAGEFEGGDGAGATACAEGPGGAWGGGALPPGRPRSGKKPVKLREREAGVGAGAGRVTLAEAEVPSAK